MTTDNGPGSLGRLAVVALLAGLTAGAGLLYVRGVPDGNQPGTVAAPAPVTADITTKAPCGAASAARAKVAGEAAKGDVAALLAQDAPKLLTMAPFNGPDGKAMTLADFTGKTLLVNLWATWCAPCRAEMPALDRLQAAKGGKDFEVVAINIDTGGDEKPKEFLDEAGVRTLAYYRDASIGVFNDLRKQGLVTGLPATLLVDRDGCLIASMNGPAEWGGTDAEALIGAVTSASSN